MRRLLPVLAVLAALAATPSAAAPQSSTLIRPGVGIGGIDLGDRLEGVRRRLGKPDFARRTRWYGIGWITEHTWGGGSGFDWVVRVEGRGDGARVVTVATGLPSQRTPGGLGVGSSDRAVRRTGARCRRAPGKTYEHWTLACRIGRAGKPKTYFNFTRDCLVPEDRHRICPKSKLRFRVYEVQIVDARGA